MAISPGIRLLRPFVLLASVALTTVAVGDEVDPSLFSSFLPAHETSGILGEEIWDLGGAFGEPSDAYVFGNVAARPRLDPEALQAGVRADVERLAQRRRDARLAITDVGRVGHVFERMAAIEERRIRGQSDVPSIAAQLTSPYAVAAFAPPDF